MNRRRPLQRRTPLRAACPTGKKRYDTETAADWALAHAIDVHTLEGRAKVERRAYSCDRCAGWHLTSRTTHRPTKPAPARTGPDATTVGLVLARDNLACIRCASSVLGATHSIHHRLPRGRGGSNDPTNLITLCGSGTTGCHGWVESYRRHAYMAGLLVPTGSDPATVAVQGHDGWWLLAADGSRTSSAPHVGVLRAAPSVARRAGHATGA